MKRESIPYWRREREKKRGVEKTTGKANADQRWKRARSRREGLKDQLIRPRKGEEVRSGEHAPSKGGEKESEGKRGREKTTTTEAS